MKELPWNVNFYSVLTDILAVIMHTVCGVLFLNGYCSVLMDDLVQVINLEL
jgi:hypothetical protein